MCTSELYSISRVLKNQSIEFPMKFGAFLNSKTLTTGTKRTPPRSVTALSASSSLFKSVCLHDWWLIKPPEGEEGLAVAGISSREGKNVRAFRSAAISKRYDATTLGTVDGFTIALVGFINKDLTLQNGFSSEVCSLFQLGFSYDWEEYSVKGSNKIQCIRSSSKPTIKTCSSNRINYRWPEDQPFVKDRDCHLLTMKATDDLFECVRDLEHNESLLSLKDNNVNTSEGVTMAPLRIQLTNSDDSLLQEGCGLAKTVPDDTNPLETSVRYESFSESLGSRKLGNIDRHAESDHIIKPKKRKFGDVAEGSLNQERININSAKMDVSVESPVTLETEGNPRIINNKPKPTRSRRITRSMTKEKIDHPRRKK